MTEAGDGALFLLYPRVHRSGVVYFALLSKMLQIWCLEAQRNYVKVAFDV